jgi:hypothetical protein
MVMSKDSSPGSPIGPTTARKTNPKLSSFSG